MSPTRLISVRDLDAGHGGVAAVRGLTMHVDSGEVVALLGPNGAGKTTTLMTIAGLLRPISGDVEVCGSTKVFGAAHVMARSGVRFVPEDRGLFFGLTVAENLRLARGSSRSVSTDEVLDLFPALRDLLTRRSGLLSGGEQQMLGIAKALVAGPRVVLIDEMSAGLAPLIVERLLPIIRSLASERNIGVLLVEQHVHLALRCADRAYVLRHGELVTSGPAAEVAARTALIEASYLGQRCGTPELAEPSRNGLMDRQPSSTNP